MHCQAIRGTLWSIWPSTTSKEPSNRLRNRISAKVSRLALVGDHRAIHALDFPSSFNLDELLIEATSFSPPNTYEERARRSSNEPNASFPSLVHRASAVLASFTPSDSETNDTVANYFCSYDNSSVTSITMVPTGSKWFNFPSCISYWTGLSNVFCTNCRVLNFGNLPSSVRSLLLQSVIGGTWSQADAGTSSGPDADYFDWSWLSNLPLLTSMSMSYSSLNGTLPNHLNHSLLQSLSLQLTGTGNPLIGTISPSWFLQYPDMTSMVLSNNKISGTFPNYALQKLTGVQFDNNEISHFPPLIINATSSAPTLLTTMSFSNNKLVQIPSESDFQAMTALSYIYLHSNPDLSGTFPNLWNRSGSTLLLDIQANNCSFSGALPEMPESLIATYAAATIQQLSFNSNRFTGTIPASWSSLNFRYLFLQDNPGLGGALATIDDDGNILSQFVHSVVFLAISGSGFTGPMFNISTLTALQTLTVQTPNVDFCIQTRLNNASQPSAFPSSLGNCDLSTTNASVCDSMYPPICVTTEWIPPMTPVSSPVTPPTASTNCPLPSPGDKFLCKDGIWVSSGSVTEQTITIAPSSTVIVNGNLTTSSVVIASTSSTINVTGCISTESGSAPAVTVTLTQSDLEKIIKNGGSLTSTLIQQSSGCNLSLATSSLSVDTSSIKSCKTVKTDKIGTSSGLTATFTVVSTSKCNTWWIILVSVVCGAVLIALVAILVVCNVLKKNRHRKERAGLSG